MAFTQLTLADLARAYTETIVTLTANQAAGIDPIVAANGNRSALVFTADADFQISGNATAARGRKVFGSVGHAFIGAECKAGALYLVPNSGLSAGNTLLVEEA